MRKSERMLFNCKRLAGLEIEYSCCRGFTYISEWTKKWSSSVYHDGSCGFEAVTVPAAGDYLVNQIDDVCLALWAAKAKTNIRCGVHVHVDARDLGWYDIKRLVTVYAYVEAFIYLLGGQHRSMTLKTNGQNYCAPNGHKFVIARKSPEWRDDILSAIYSTSNAKGIRSSIRTSSGMHKKPHSRYVGLNLCPWVYGRVGRGKNVKTDTTIEFRMHRDCADAQRLIGWTKLLVRVVDWCKNATDNDVDQLLFSKKHKSAARVLCELAPDCAAWILHRLKSWRKAVRYGRRRIHFKKGMYVFGRPRQPARKSEPESWEEVA